MGVSVKWVRALVGLKKSEKLESSEKDKVGKFWHRRKHSIEVDNSELQHEFDNAGTPPIEVPDTHSIHDVHHLPSTSQQAEDHNHQIVREEWAATYIQSSNSISRIFGQKSTKSFERIGKASGPCKRSCSEKTSCNNSPLYASFGEGSGSCSGKTCSFVIRKSNSTTETSAAACK